MSRKFLIVAVGSLMTALLVWSPAAASTFQYQKGPLQPLQQSRIYRVHGTPTTAGCRYTYPAMRVPRTVRIWQARDIAIDDASCTKLVEEGAPLDQATPADNARAAGVGGAALLPAAGTTASGFAHAWFENFVGQTLTSDKTYLTWSYSGGCVTGSSTYGGWDWNYGYGWSLASNNGSRSQICARATGSTWSTFNGLNGCHEYYYYVNAVGDASGGFTGTRSDSATCGPVWEHFEYVKTT